jgi:hypothetical protein
MVYLIPSGAGHFWGRREKGDNAMRANSAGVVAPHDEVAIFTPR